jgi:drug/metabolite transporter (DMT)-like permease
MYDYSVNALDLCLVRTCVVASFNLLQIKQLGIEISVPRSLWLTMLMRNLAGLVGFTSLVYALKYLPMGLFMVLVNTSPFFAALLGFIFLKESLMTHEIIAMSVSFTAIAILATLKQDNRESTSEFDLNNPHVRLLGIITAMLHVVGTSTITVCTRRM